MGASPHLLPSSSRSLQSDTSCARKPPPDCALEGRCTPSDASACRASCGACATGMRRRLGTEGSEVMWEVRGGDENVPTQLLAGYGLLPWPGNIA